MDAKLTFYQQQVLMHLSTRSAASITDWGVWYPMRCEQVRGVMNGLYRRGLVDVAGFDDRARTYAITRKGNEALEAGQAAAEETT